MEAIILMGLPGSGKSSFYRSRFFDTHVRISLDLLRTRYRERRLLEFCLETDQRLVIDNTNPTKSDRRRYLEPVRAARVRYRVLGFCFETDVAGCLIRNTSRAGLARVPDVAVLSAAKRFEFPSADEGFDQLFYVRLLEDGFDVKELSDS